MLLILIGAPQAEIFLQFWHLSWGFRLRKTVLMSPGTALRAVKLPFFSPPPPTPSLTFSSPYPTHPSWPPNGAQRPFGPLAGGHGGGATAQIGPSGLWRGGHVAPRPPRRGGNRQHWNIQSFFLFVFFFGGGCFFLNSFFLQKMKSLPDFFGRMKSLPDLGNLKEISQIDSLFN